MLGWFPPKPPALSRQPEQTEKPNQQLEATLVLSRFFWKFSAGSSKGSACCNPWWLVAKKHTFEPKMPRRLKIPKNRHLYTSLEKDCFFCFLVQFICSIRSLKVSSAQSVSTCESQLDRSGREFYRARLFTNMNAQLVGENSRFFPKSRFIYT